MPPRRSPLARVSRKRRRANRTHDAIRQAVFARDGGCLVAAAWHHDPLVHALSGSCFGPLTPHHRRKERQGGAYSLANLCTLCLFHNELLESDADFAAWGRSVGIVVRRGDPEWHELGESEAA